MFIDEGENLRMRSTITFFSQEQCDVHLWDLSLAMDFIFLFLLGGDTCSGALSIFRSDFYPSERLQWPIIWFRHISEEQVTSTWTTFACSTRMMSCGSIFVLKHPIRWSEDVYDDVCTKMGLVRVSERTSYTDEHDNWLERWTHQVLLCLDDSFGLVYPPELQTLDSI